MPPSTSYRRRTERFAPRPDLAAALHRHGACPAAHATIDHGWTLRRFRHHRRDPNSDRMCARLAMMDRNHGGPDQAQPLFAHTRHGNAARLDTTPLPNRAAGWWA